MMTKGTSVCYTIVLVWFCFWYAKPRGKIFISYTKITLSKLRQKKPCYVNSTFVSNFFKSQIDKEISY